MKIVFASTPSQEKEICELVRYIYSSIFPNYFTDEEITEFKRLKVLDTTGHHFEDFSTLKDAFQVMTSIQTVISVLESSPPDEQYADLFNKNVENLEEYGLFFPFQFEQFTEAKVLRNSELSIYSKADNELLI